MRNVLLALSLLAAPVLAQGSPDKSAVPAGRYTADTAHTQVVFTLKHLGFTYYTGQFTQPTGTLTLDTAHPENDRVEISFPIAKVSTTVSALDEHLQKPEFFDAAKYPDGKFVSTRVTVSGNSATIAGNLTLKGVTKPVVLQASFVGVGTNPLSKQLNVGFMATTTVKRSDFGVSYGLPMVGDDVNLTINAAFVPTAG